MNQHDGKIPLPSDVELLAVALLIDLEDLRRSFRAGADDGYISAYNETPESERCRHEGARIRIMRPARDGAR